MSEQEKENTYKEKLEIHIHAARYFYSNLHAKGKESFRIPRKRKVDKNTGCCWLGYATISRNDLYHYLMSKDIRRKFFSKWIVIQKRSRVF